MKMATFWVVAPCSMVWITEAARIFETSVNFYHTTLKSSISPWFDPGESTLFKIILLRFKDANWKTAPCRLSATVCSIYMQLPSISRDFPLHLQNQYVPWHGDMVTIWHGYFGAEKFKSATT
jgi:hypothetical protein